MYLPTDSAGDNTHRVFRGVAQLAEHRSPKPGAAGSIPVSPAKPPLTAVIGWLKLKFTRQPLASLLANSLEESRDWPCPLRARKLVHSASCGRVT